MSKNNSEVPIQELDLKDNPQLLSPPIIKEPLYSCAVSVTLLAFEPHAEVDLEIDGVIQVTTQVGFPMPNGESIPLASALVAGQQVRARQRNTSAQSIWSNFVTVRDHTEDYPAGPPRPQINPAPVFQCGSRTGVSNLLDGGTVWITANGTEVGRVKGCKDHQGVNVDPDYGINQRIRAWFEMCSDASPPSIEHITQVPPSPLPSPGIDSAYDGGEQIRITNVVNGARVTIYRNGINQGTWRCWGYALLVGIGSPLSSGETLEASQTMCPSNPDSPKGSTIVEPCSNLPAPRVGPVQSGDDRITLVEFVSDAIIKVYINFVKAGEGAGPIVLLDRQIAHGDIIHVQQLVGTCSGLIVREVHPHCVAPSFAYDPSALDLFPVGHLEYENGDAKGSIYYPANDDGEGQPFNNRLASSSRVPIVFMAHGNHGIYYNPENRLEESCSPESGWLPIPNYQGYDYFQQHLAQMGIIAVSVDCNTTNCTGLGILNIEQRADLIISTIVYLQSLDTDSSSIFYQHIDFHSIGLMGHSRGGEAVVLVPEVIGLPGINIKAVISLAPTDAGASTGQPKDYAFMTILPAGDGDVQKNPGAKFYDKAIPGPLKSQLYVHYANHNFFNRQWPEDDGVGAPVMSRHDHERILLVYGCSIFRVLLLGHSNQARFLSGHILPVNVASGNTHLSFQHMDSFTVDNHEDNNGIGLNSLNLPTTQSGALHSDEYTFGQGAGSAAFNTSFYGNTIGMVIEDKKVNGVFRSQLPEQTSISKKEIWIRVAEVYNTVSIPADHTGFELGLEDRRGIIVWVDSDDVGGLPRPYDRGGLFTKTMLKTLRFPGRCFTCINSALDINNPAAILIRTSRGDGRALAIDDLQIQEEII
jgi:dienelactone hydrolase